jgi:DNA-entry nuclease
MDGKRYGVAISGAHKDEYTICRARDMATCPYHKPGSHEVLTKDEFIRRNESIISSRMRPAILSKSTASNRLSHRRSASTSVKRAIRSTIIAAIGMSAVWSLSACGQTEYAAPPVSEPSSSQSQSSDTSSLQDDLDKAKNSDTYQKIKDKANELKNSEAYKNAKESVKNGMNDLLSSGRTGGSSQTASGSDAKLLSSWNASTAPDYYAVTGKADLPSKLVSPGTVDYQGLDSLGRTGYAHAVITYKMVADSSGWRQEFDDTADSISGWKNPTTGKSNNGETSIVLDNGKTYHGYFYNRSHLVADSLGGAATRTNLLTGTRTQNVGDNSSNPGGMAYAESKIRDYLKDHQDVTTAYYVQPVYNGNEIVPRGTTIDMKTSDGAINEHVVVWNYANGHTIDYSTGSWK